MANKIEIIVQGVDRASGVFASIGATLGRIAFATAAAGIALVSKTLTDSVKSAMESEKAMAELNAVLKSTKGVAGVSIDALTAHAEALQKVTMFSDEAINAGQSMLLTFTNIGADVFPQATEAVLNLAEKFGSVDQAAVQLGKALNDPIAGVTALRRVGVMLSDEQEKQIKDFMAVNDIASAQGVILAELETEFGGLARAMGETTAGKLAILNNQLDNLKEKLGAALIPMLIKAADAFTKFIESADFKKFFDALVAGDWDSIISIISEQLGKLSTAFASIDWAKVSSSIIAGIEKIDWAGLGNSIGDGLASAWDYASSEFMDIVKGTDWGGLYEASSLALLEFLAGLTNQGSWANVYSTWESNINQLVEITAKMTPLVRNHAAETVKGAAQEFSFGGVAIGNEVIKWIPQIEQTLKSFGVIFYTRATIWVQQATAAIRAAGPALINAVSKLIEDIQGSIKPVSFTISLPNFALLAEIAAAGYALVQDAMSGGGTKGGKSTAPGGGSGGGGGGGGATPTALGSNSVLPSDARWVGERGPELFIPNTSGRIIPNSGLFGGGDSNMIVNLTYAPAFSTASQSEFVSSITPMLDAWYRKAKRS